MLGEGTYSKVYSVFDTSKSHKVAVKVIPREYFDSAIREIVMINACSHANIISLLRVEYTNFETRLYMAQFPEDLLVFINKNMCLPPLTVYKMARDILAGCTYLHNRGIIHCDLKPQNILVSPRGLTICDFGLAVLSKERRHATGLQTCSYRAPEVNVRQLRRHSPKIDVWSIGCILYEIISKVSLIKNPNRDSAVCAAELFGIPGSNREHCSQLLKFLNAGHVYSRIYELVPVAVRATYRESGYIRLISKCLYPVSNLRCEAKDAYKIVCTIIQTEEPPETPVRLGRKNRLMANESPPRIHYKPRFRMQYDDMLCARNIPCDVLKHIHYDCLIFAERIYRDYCGDAVSMSMSSSSLTDSTMSLEEEIDQPAFLVSYACIYIATCIFSGSYVGFMKQSYKALQGEVINIMSHYSGRLFIGEKNDSTVCVL